MWFRLDIYENMLRDVFFRQLRQHPLYFIKTFLIHQPVALIRTIGEVLVSYSSIIFSPIMIVLVLAAAWATGRSARILRWHRISPLLVATVCSLLPIAIVAPMPIRIFDTFTLLVLLLYIGLAVGAAQLVTQLLRRQSQRVQA